MFIRNRAGAFTKDQIESLFANDQETWNRLSSSAKIKCKVWLQIYSNFSGGKDEFIIIHFGGKNLKENIKHIIEKHIPEKNSTHVWTNEKTVSDYSKLIFETWREEN